MIAREAAAEVARRTGLHEAHVAAMEVAAERCAFFVVYGRTAVAIDQERIQVSEAERRRLGLDELDASALRAAGRRIVVLSACTGSDARAVGSDEIMNVKGYAGDHGLERYPCFDAQNLGLGGQVRVGLEDDLRLARGVLARGSDELASHAVDLAERAGRPVAGAAQARIVLGIKPLHAG